MTEAPEPQAMEELLDLPLLQQMQDSFAEMTGMTVIVCRRDGKIITRPSFGNVLWRTLYERNPESLAPCLASAVQAAQQIGEDETGTGPFHIEELDHYAAPIVVNRQRLATLVLKPDQAVCRAAPSPERIAELTGLPEAQVSRLLETAQRDEPARLGGALRFLHSLAMNLAYTSYRERLLRRRVNELTMLQSLALMLAGRADVEEVLNITAREVVKVVEARACSIRVYDPERKELSVRAVANLSAEYLRKGPVRLEESQIDQKALSGEPVQIKNMGSDPRVIYKAEAQREGLVSGLAVGMLYADDPMGVIHVYSAAPRRWDPVDIDTLKAIASLAAAALKNAQLHQEALRAEQMDRQLEFAGEVQRRMLPQSVPNVPGLQIGMSYAPTYQVGGDFFDFLKIEDGKLGVVIADVAGKGVPASLQMAFLKSALRAYASEGFSLLKIVQSSNRAFRSNSLANEFASLFFALIDPVSGVLEYLDAGHGQSALVRAGEIRPLKVTGPVMGVFENPNYQTHTVALQENDALVLFTDGLTDAMNFDQERYGEERLHRSILKHAHLPAQAMAEDIFWDVRRFAGLATQSDDISLVVIQYKPTRTE